MASTVKKTETLRDVIDEKIQQLRKKAPHKFGSVLFSRKHREPSQFSIVLENGCISFYLDRDTMASKTDEVSKIYLDSSAELILLNFSHYHEDPTIEFSSSPLISNDEYRHFAENYKSGFVIFVGGATHKPNVFLFDNRKERSEWAHLIKHSLLLAEHDFSLNQSKVYIFLEDCDLKQYAPKLIKRGFSSIRRIANMDLVDLCWCARNLDMNEKQIESLARAVFKLQNLSKNRTNVSKKLSLFNTTDKAIVSESVLTGGDEEISIEMLKEVLTKFNVRESTYDDVLRDFIASEKSSFRYLRNSPFTTTESDLKKKANLEVLFQKKETEPKEETEQKEEIDLKEEIESRKESIRRLESLPEDSIVEENSNVGNFEELPLPVRGSVEPKSQIIRQKKSKKPSRVSRQKSKASRSEDAPKLPTRGTKVSRSSFFEVKTTHEDDVESVLAEQGYSSMLSRQQSHAEVKKKQTIIDSSDMEVYGWGGLPTTALPVLKPLTLEPCPTPLDIIVGYKNVAVIDVENDVYV